jgi:hypothetical protein
VPGGNCNTKAGDVVGVAEVTDLFAFGRYGQRCDSDIQRAVRNPVQVPSLFFIANGGTSLVPTISVRLGVVCPCASMEMPARIITNTYDPSQSFYEIHFVSLQN